MLGIEYSASVGHGRGCRLPSEDCVLVEIMGRLLPLLNQFAQVATCIRSKSLSAPSQVTRGLGRTFVVIHQNVHVRPIAERAAIGHNVGVVHIDHHLRGVSSQGAGGGIVGWARTSISRRACADRSMSMSTAGCAGANPKLIHGRRPHAVAVAAPVALARTRLHCACAVPAKSPRVCRDLLLARIQSRRARRSHAYRRRALASSSRCSAARRPASFANSSL